MLTLCQKPVQEQILDPGTANICHDCVQMLKDIAMTDAQVTHSLLSECPMLSGRHENPAIQGLICAETSQYVPCSTGWYRAMPTTWCTACP